MIKKLKTIIIMKKEKKKYEKRVLNQKEKFKKFIDYLLDSYYLNPKKQFTIKEITNKLKINNNLIFKEFLEYLEENDYINIKKETKKFRLSYKGFVYLETLQQENKKYENNLINVVMTISAFIISLYALWESAIMIVLGTVFGFVILIRILKLTK